MAAIAATRQEVSDRFEILGFTINTGNRPFFEVVLVTDVAVLGDKSRRSPSNFWASGRLPAERGEAVFLVPPDILRRFAGQARLWYGYATFADRNRGQPEIVTEPTASSPWVSLSAYTGRSRRRALTLRPERRAANGNYGAQNPGEFEWAGDAVKPRSETNAPAPTPPSIGNRKTGASTNGNGNGNAGKANDGPSTAPSSAQAHRGNYGVAYDDGFGPLPPETEVEHDDDRSISGPIEDSDPALISQGLAVGRAFTETPEYPAAVNFVPARHFNHPSSPRTINRIVIHITDGQGRAQGTADYFRDPQQWLRIDEENGELQVEREGDVVKRFRTGGRWKACVDGKTKQQGNRTVGLARVSASAHYVVGQAGEIIQMVRHADVAWHAGSANNDTIGIEHNARTPGTFGKNDAGLMPADIQYQCSARLVCWLCQQFGIPKDRTHILGHAEADPNTTHTACPNSVWDWDKYMGFVTDGSCDPAIDTASQAFETQIPLDPGTGGMSIAEDALQMGDIIVATTDDPVSRGIRAATGAPVSHAMIFTGDGGQVVEAVADGVVFRPLTEALASATVAVAFRKPDLTEEQRLLIRDFVGQQIDRRYNYWGIVRQAQFIINSSVCNLLPDDAKERCRTFYGRVYLGSGSNDTFFCSELVASAYQAAGVPLTTTPASWATPGGLADLQLSGELSYVGHLKAPPISSGQAFNGGAAPGERAYRAAPRAGAMGSSRLPLPAVARVAQRLRHQGVNAMALDAFCNRLNAPAAVYPRSQQRFSWPFTTAKAPVRVPITLPAARTIEGWQAELLLAALETILGPFGAAWAIPALRQTATTANVSIGVGPAVGGGLLGGAGLGAGIVFAPGNIFGIYGAAELSAGLIASISANLQLTVMGGGLDKFGGEGYAVGFFAGEGLIGGAAVLLTTSGNFQGVSGQVGVGVGLSPVDIYLSAQRTYTTSLGFGRARSFDASSNAAFSPEAIERMRQEFVNGVAAGTETSLTQAGMRKLFDAALRNPDGSDKPLGSTVGETAARLTEYGLAGPPQPFEFVDSGGQVTLGVQRPQQLHDSIETWLQDVAQKSSGWRVFILSILDGYHSAVITVDNHTNGSVGFRLFWADQIDSGWDNISGALDRRVAERTQAWWDPLPADQKARTRATLWPIIPASNFAAAPTNSPNGQPGALAEIEPDYSSVSDFAGAAAVFADWLARRLRFTIGVPSTTFFPHSAICKIRAIDANGNSLGEGTGFYVGRTTVMTAGHVVNGAGGVEVIPGMNGADTQPFAAASVPGPFRFPAGYRGAQDDTTERDVALIDGAPEAPNGQFFEMEELRMSPQTGIIVCGYAATGFGVDPDRQHMDVDSIRELHNGTFTYGIETRPGTSGGPVFYTPDASTIRVVGVHVSGNDSRTNKGVRLTDALIALI